MANPTKSQSVMTTADGQPMVGDQASHVADLAAAALSTSNTYTDAAVNAALDLVIDKVNAILVVLEDHGLVADS